MVTAGETATGAVTVGLYANLHLLNGWTHSKLFCQRCLSMVEESHHSAQTTIWYKPYPYTVHINICLSGGLKPPRRTSVCRLYGCLCILQGSAGPMWRAGPMTDECTTIYKHGPRLHWRLLKMIWSRSKVLWKGCGFQSEVKEHWSVLHLHFSPRGCHSTWSMLCMDS